MSLAFNSVTAFKCQPFESLNEFFQIKYHGKIYSPRGLVQCENVQIMDACAMYIFLPDGTAQIYSVLRNHLEEAEQIWLI